MYQVEHDELFAGIRAGKPINNGETAAHSTLMAIMGREAAYTGKRITWKQMLGSKQTWRRRSTPGAPNPGPGVPMPGQYKFA